LAGTLTGHQTCGELRSGTSVLDEMGVVEHRFHFDQGVLFVSAESTNPCPDYASSGAAGSRNICFIQTRTVGGHTGAISGIGVTESMTA